MIGADLKSYLKARSSPTHVGLEPPIATCHVAGRRWGYEPVPSVHAGAARRSDCSEERAETMLAEIATCVVSAAAIGALGIAWRRGTALPIALRRRHEADHETLHAGPWQARLPPDCDTGDARLLVLCAPSRRIPAGDFSPSAGVKFAHEQLHFEGDVAYSSVNDGVRIEPPRTIHGFSDYVWVCANGKIQLSVTVPVATDPTTGRRVLDALGVMRSLDTVARAVGSREYRQLHQLPSSAARVKTDWLIGVSMYSRPDAIVSQSSWQDLQFAGVPASRLVADRDPFCPPTGYASSDLQDWEINRPVADLLRVLLRSFLAENGYDDFDAAIDALIATHASSPAR